MTDRVEISESDVLLIVDIQYDFAGAAHWRSRTATRWSRRSTASPNGFGMSCSHRTGTQRGTSPSPRRIQAGGCRACTQGRGVDCRSEKVVVGTE